MLSATTGRLLLASASQDKNIRIWAIVPEEQADAVTATRIDAEQPMLPAVISRWGCSAQLAVTAICLRHRPSRRLLHCLETPPHGSPASIAFLLSRSFAHAVVNINY